MNKIKSLMTSFIIAGLIMLIIGLYYLVIKAGIPYQDPTVEMQIQYSVNMGIGNTLTTTGFIMTVLGIICRIITGLISKKKGN